MSAQDVGVTVNVFVGGHCDYVCTLDIISVCHCVRTVRLVPESGIAMKFHTNYDINHDYHIHVTCYAI